MPSQPFVGHEPRIVITVIFFIVLLNSDFALLPVVPDIRALDIPIGSSPYNNIVYDTVRTVLNIRYVGRRLAAIIDIARQRPLRVKAFCQAEREVSIV